MKYTLSMRIGLNGSLSSESKKFSEYENIYLKIAVDATENEHIITIMPLLVHIIF